MTFNVTNGTMSFPSYIMGKSSTQSATNPIAAWTNMIDSVRIGNGVTSIGNYAFQTCYSLASAIIPSSVTSIGTNAFYNCNSLASINIPSSVTSISAYVFGNCYSLASITIPSLVTSISTFAFYNCYGIKTYDFRTATAVPTLSDVNAFYGTPSDKEIVVPDELYNTWKAASNWNSTTNNIVNCIVKASESSLGPLS